MFGLFGSGASTFRPSTWSTGDVTQAAGGGAKSPSSGPTVTLNAWNHIAWVNKSTDNSNIYLFVNGVSCGTVTCGTNASTTSDWTRVRIASILSYTGFDFKGMIGGLRVSNTAVYDTAFTAPDVLISSSSTVLLLIDNFKK